MACDPLAVVAACAPGAAARAPSSAPVIMSFSRFTSDFLVGWCCGIVIGRRRAVLYKNAQRAAKEAQRALCARARACAREPEATTRVRRGGAGTGSPQAPRGRGRRG